MHDDMLPSRRVMAECRYRRRRCTHRRQNRHGLASSAHRPWCDEVLSPLCGLDAARQAPFVGCPAGQITCLQYVRTCFTSQAESSIRQIVAMASLAISKEVSAHSAFAHLPTLRTYNTGVRVRAQEQRPPPPEAPGAEKPEARRMESQTTRLVCVTRWPRALPAFGLGSRAQLPRRSTQRMREGRPSPCCRGTRSTPACRWAARWPPSRPSRRQWRCKSTTCGTA